MGKEQRLAQIKNRVQKGQGDTSQWGRPYRYKAAGKSRRSRPTAIRNRK
jgi:hypothetical protein